MKKTIMFIMFIFLISNTKVASAGLFEWMFEGPYDPVRNNGGQAVMSNAVALVTYYNDLFGYVGILANNTSNRPMCYRIICSEPGFADTKWQEVSPIKPGNRWSTGKEIIRIKITSYPGQYNIELDTALAFLALPLPINGSCANYNGVVEREKGWVVDHERFKELSGLDFPLESKSMQTGSYQKAGADHALLNAKTAFYDIYRIAELSAPGMKLSAALKMRADAYKSELETKYADIEKIKRQIDKERILLSNAEYNRKLADYKKRLENLKNDSVLMKEELRTSAESMRKKLEEKISSAALKIKINGQYDWIFEKNSNPPIPYDSAKDITDLLIKEVNLTENP
jgi:Skp family chaperone for outer membrane proteins